MVLLRGCVLHLLTLVGLASAYVWILLPRLPKAGAIVLGAFGALLTWLLASTLVGLLASQRDRARIARAARGGPATGPPRDGERVAVIGTLEPQGEPLTAPWSGRPALAYAYEVERDSLLRPRHDRNAPPARGGPVRDWHGVALAPSVVRGAGGDVRLLALPDLDFVPRWRRDDPSAFARASTLLERVDSASIKVSPSRILQALASFEQVLADDSGAIERHWRHGHPGGLDPSAHRLFERLVEPGAAVCLLGRYDARRHGLAGGVRWGELIRLIPAPGCVTPAEIAAAAKRQLARTGANRLATAFGFFLVVHAMILLAVHLEAGTRREQAAIPGRAADGRTIHQLVAADDHQAIRAYAAAGGDLDLADNLGAAPIFGTARADTKLLLLELGADPNVRNYDRSTLLQNEAREGNPQVLARLLELGVDLEATDDRGDTALTQVILADGRDAIAALRAAGAHDFRVDASTGQPLPTDGGPPFAVVRAYLGALAAGDADAIGRRVSWPLDPAASASDLIDAAAIRPTSPELVEGYWRHADGARLRRRRAPALELPPDHHRARPRRRGSTARDAALGGRCLADSARMVVDRGSAHRQSSRPPGGDHRSLESIGTHPARRLTALFRCPEHRSQGRRSRRRRSRRRAPRRAGHG